MLALADAGEYPPNKGQRNIHVDDDDDNCVRASHWLALAQQEQQQQQQRRPLGETRLPARAGSTQLARVPRPSSSLSRSLDGRAAKFVSERESIIMIIRAHNSNQAD
jgi:hypothetical protein